MLDALPNTSGITRIATAGDGFAANHIWPMWPHILQMTTVNTTVTSLGKIGAGNEYIFNSVLDHINHHRTDLVIVQWAMCSRLDLLVDSAEKNTIILADTVYSENVYNNWWLSSASTQQYITTYHRNYIGYQQHLLRTKNYIISLAAILNQRGIPFKFTNTYSSELYPDLDIDWTDWLWHEPGQGMQEYSLQSKFTSTRSDQVQPSPIVHLEWIQEILAPTLDLTWEQGHISKLTHLFNSGDWHGLLPHYCARSKQN